MKEYYGDFITKDEKSRVSLSSSNNEENKRVGTLAIDIGVDGFFAELSKNELSQLQVMIKECLKKI